MLRMMAMVVALAPAGPAAARIHADTGTFVARDTRFATGEALPEVRIFYRTLGHRRTGPGGITRNAVLLLHGTGGSGQEFLAPALAGEIFGPGQPLDTSQFYVIIPDNIGHGRSSKPSDGPGPRFPHFVYADMVGLQHRLMTEGLGVTHLHLVMGAGMGCLHAWMWVERWPDFLDGAVALDCLPTRIAGNDGPRTSGRTPDAPDADPAAWARAGQDSADATDLRYALDASRDCDPSADLERITAPVLAINGSDGDPEAPGIMERVLSRARHARSVRLPAGPGTRSQGMRAAAAWRPYVAEFLREIRVERQE